MVKLYTIDCPACNVLEKKLKAKNIEYTAIRDEKIFDELKMEQFPQLGLEDGTILSFGEAVTWLAKGGNNG